MGDSRFLFFSFFTSAIFPCFHLQCQQSMLDKILTIDETNFAEAVELLCNRDKDLSDVVAEHGHPPLFARQPGFATLVHIILEQQVSLASARATFERLKQKLEALTPELFLTLADEILRSLGFSRQKILYTRNLATAIVNNDLDLDAFEKMTDEEVILELTKLKGIGRWTADVYLLMSLRRADAYPIGDLGLIVGTQTVKKLLERPATAELEAIGEGWRPFRAVATRIIWHYYLKKIRPFNNY